MNADSFPNVHEREVGKEGVAAVRATLKKATKPTARRWDPLPSPRPIDPSEPRSEQEPF